MMILAACDDNISAADSLLDGAWNTATGERIVFRNGTYTKTFAQTDTEAETEKGTFVTDGMNITFSRPGHSPETLSYSLAFPVLTIGSIQYYHDSPGEPESLEGKWFPYPAYGNALVFEKAELKKGGGGINEGKYFMFMDYRGAYITTSRNIPNTSTVTVYVQDVHGAHLRSFIMNDLLVDILTLFNMDKLSLPVGFDVTEWWYTLEEARSIFEDAAGKAWDLVTESRVMYARDYFFSSLAPSTYDYSIEEDDELPYRYFYAAEGMNKLSLRAPIEHGGWVRTFFRASE